MISVCVCVCVCVCYLCAYVCAHLQNINTLFFIAVCASSCHLHLSKLIIYFDMITQTFFNNPRHYKCLIDVINISMLLFPLTEIRSLKLYSYIKRET